MNKLFTYNIYGEVIDKKQYENLIILHLIDINTQYNHSYCHKCNMLIRNSCLSSHLFSSPQCIHLKKIKKKEKKGTKTHFDNCKLLLNFD